jgi:hemolysin activation/secretion protein
MSIPASFCGSNERQPTGRLFQCGRIFVRRRFSVLLLLVCWMPMATWHLAAAEPDAVAATPAFAEKQPDPRFNVRGYVVNGHTLLATNTLNLIFSRHTGTNVDLKEIVRVAAELQSENERQGYPPISVAIMPEHITNGIVTLNIFQAVYPQIMVSGRRYLDSGEMAEAVTNSPTTLPAMSSQQPTVTATTNVNPIAPIIHLPPLPASPEDIAKAQAALMKAMADLDAREKDTRVHVVSTNAGPRFDVEKYLVAGNSVLPPKTIAATLTNIDGAYGTNVSFDGIRAAVTELQDAYRERGYVTVSVGVPQQKLTNATVKLQVMEGRLAAINVNGNKYFSSNNVMRALPSLHTNTILNGLIFQAELNRANANQDRQIYPVIAPGLEPGTSELTLKVKDRLPLHAKVDFNNENSPGTPVLRVNTSAVYDNLWQMEHSLGVQYSFSPETYKQGNMWDFYDRPMVANYSAFYRLPLGNPQPVEDIIANNPNNFGYSEATHKFNLPPPSGQTELTLYASRSTIDTGLENISSTNFINIPGVRVVNDSVVQQDITINETMGFRLNKPLPEINDIHSALSGGMDFKIYSPISHGTNIFNFTEITRKPDGSLNPPIVSSVDNAIPSTAGSIEYLPLALHYDATWSGVLGVATLGLDASGNVWYSGSISNLQSNTRSTKSTGHWVTLDPSLTWIITFPTNWTLTIHANGQWASEPLISSEQFGAGGVNSVRGYHEGEVFGDEGWHVSLEQATPPHIIGFVNGDIPLTVRGSIYTDYARTILLDPLGPPEIGPAPNYTVTYPLKRPGSVPLWGAGFGATASIGSHWQARFLFSFPLLSAGTIHAWQPYFNFGLTAQF